MKMSCAPSFLLNLSAGVGRTGTFIVIDAMMNMMHAEGRVDVFSFVSRIRNQRCQLVQTDVRLPCLLRPEIFLTIMQNSQELLLSCLYSCRCSTRLFIKLCWSITCTVTQSWTFLHWRATYTDSTVLTYTWTEWGLRRNSE